MTISSSISRKLAFAAAVFFICVLPANALAALRITAVMYDPDGPDQGREWVQVTNEGSEPVALMGYRLFEGGTNHKLSAAVGTSTIAAGAKAIIATDPAQYMSEHPSFTGTIFKSSFSLSNNGETIELRDAKLATVDSYTYTAPPVAPKAAKSTSVKKSTKTAKAPAGKSSYIYTDNTMAGDMAASPMLLNPLLPQVSGVWLYGLALVATVLLGACALLYAKFSAPISVTPASLGEFELED